MSGGRAGYGTEGVLDGFEVWLERAARVFSGVASARARLSAALEQVRGAGARIEAPLVILLAGGTGAGKSTLLNALAGAEVAHASPVRPTTTALTCYHHAANELAIPGALGRARRAAHERPELLDKVILDAPDFDSIVEDNERALRAALVEADLVVLLATPEKYADADLYAILEEYRAGRAFVFALNRLDRGIDPAVVADFRGELERAGFEVRPWDGAPASGEAPLLVLSALAALRRKRGERDPGEEGDFTVLETIIERELSRARIREIKRLNLDTLVGRLLDDAAARLPEDLPERVAAWRRAGERTGEEVRAEVAARLSAAVRDDAALRHEAAARLATRYGGLFGFYQALVWGVRGLRGRGFASVARRLAISEAALVEPGGVGRPAAPGALAAATADDEPTLAAAVSLAARRILDFGVEQGLGEAGAALEPAEAARLVASARLEADRAIETALRPLRFPEERAGAGRKVESLVLNLPPLAVVGYALYRWLEAFASGTLLGSSWFVAAVLVTIVVLALEGTLADALARRRARALVRKLEDAAAAAADDGVARPLLGRLEGLLGEVEAAAGALEDLREAARAAGATAGEGAAPAAGEPALGKAAGAKGTGAGPGPRGASPESR